jgi:hypothetical protein
VPEKKSRQLSLVALLLASAGASPSAIEQSSAAAAVHKRAYDVKPNKAQKKALLFGKRSKSFDYWAYAGWHRNAL